MRRVWLALALVAPAMAGAQPAPPVGQTRADQAIDGRLRLVTDALRGSAERLADPTASDWPAIRQSIDRAQAMLSDLPADASQEATLTRARTALSEAHEALEAEAPNRAHVAKELREAAEAMAALRPGLGSIAPKLP